MVISLYGGFSRGFALVQASREDLRGTQILLQKLEAARLCTWSQLRSYSFQEQYDPLGVTNSTGGTPYWGRVLTNAATSIPSSALYKGDMRQVTVTLYWTNHIGRRSLVQSRQMQTFVARHGMQNYVWGAGP